MESARDDTTGGRLFKVNGVPVFIRGGAWVAADALLRLSAQDYDDQVRLHAEANLNLIRVWGGSITDAQPSTTRATATACSCGKFWVTADCTNGQNPEDVPLFLSCATDAIRMLRNHASLCLWVGGNELPASTALGEQLRLLVQQEDGTRPLRLVIHERRRRPGLGRTVRGRSLRHPRPVSLLRRHLDGGRRTQTRSRPRPGPSACRSPRASGR